MVHKKLEKYAIFSNSFRGLPDGWHKLRAVNFLVGENSTGKSSFLQLIEIIDSRDHMLFLDICGIVPGVDTAFDVCSRAKNAKETTIGFLVKKRPLENPDDAVDPMEKYDSPIFGRLATYKKVKEQLQLTSLSIVSGKRVLRLRRSRDRISYRFDEYKYDEEKPHTDNAAAFEDLHFKKGSKFRTEKEVDWSSAQLPAVWLNALANVVFRDIGEEGADLLQTFPPLNCLQYGPLRGKTRRLYHGTKNDFSSTGEHFPFLIRDAIKGLPQLMHSIEKFGAESGLFDKISTVSVKTAVKDKPFALQVEKAGSVFYMDELGFGVGQILPIVSDVALSGGSFAFLIQQPELHLHPRAQASLGDVFFQAADNGGMFVIETHSDFIIDRYRLRHKQSEVKPHSQIVYFEKDSASGQNRSHEIEFLEDGSLWGIPDGYRDFFVNESIEQFENF